MTDPITLAVDPRGVATVTLNRGELHNALDGDSTAYLIAVLETLADDDSVKIVILTGSGISFSAGHDIDWLRRQADFTEEELSRDASLLSRLLETLDSLPHPTIARVQGSAFGIGVGLVTCCDIAIAASGALFGFSEVKLGTVPAVSVPYLIRTIGARAARRYLISAERFNAGKAKRLGVLHQVVELEELDAAVEQAVHQLLLNAPQAMREAKSLVNRLSGLGVGSEARTDAIATLTRVRQTAEGKEGIAAFIEKRAPGWLKP
ncbi:enoyl-CoA hydratase-related protein [Paludibacterium yongneupense]|uniref:enoyl-CoA hydratase-related protein n=1 Tax=Paludibacterium yongneupense TaxID=400061 RepID=UPI0003FA6640|nr:enoyl-CoA hydratase-related protein [Paludibacterium yongneupense]